MTTIRLLPSAAASASISVNGRGYTGTAGTPVDAILDGDAFVLSANAWIRVAQSGTTAQRPTTPARGMLFLDLTLQYLIVFDGALWRNPYSGASV